MTAASKTKNQFTATYRLAFHAVVAILALTISASANASATLVPGNGWPGATQEPGAVGNSSDPRYSAKVIGFINAVPYRDLTGPRKVDIQAFHIGGIDRVTGSLDNGPWVTVDEVTFNEQTDCWGYVFDVNPAQLADGLHEARFIAYPNVGRPFLLNYDVSFSSNVANDIVARGWHFYTNHNGTLPNEVRYVNSTSGSNGNDGLTPATAVATIANAVNKVKAAQSNNLGGGTVMLAEGNYTMPSDSTTSGNRWFTIRGAPGANRDNVRITGGDWFAFAGAKLRLAYLTNQNVEVGPQIGAARAIWTWNKYKAIGGPTNNLTMTGISLSTKPTFRKGSSGSMRFPLGQFQAADSWDDRVVYEFCKRASYGDTLVRNVELHVQPDTPLLNWRYVINLRADYIGGIGTHPDAQRHFTGQIPGWERNSAGGSSVPAENFCCVNYTAIGKPDMSLGVGAEGVMQWNQRTDTVNYRFDRVAYINFEMRRPLNTGNSSPGSWFTPSDHVLVWNCSVSGAPFETEVVGTNWSVRNCYFERYQTTTSLNNGTPNGQEYRDNHYREVSGGAFAGGAGTTTGEPSLTNAANVNDPNALIPLASSPLILNTVPQLYPVDSANRMRDAATARGARRGPLEVGGIDPPDDDDPVQPTECVSGTPAWQSQAIPPTTGLLVVEYDAVPRGLGIDGYTTISSGPANGFNDCAILIRFNRWGFIDVRNGAAYEADVTGTYTVGETYHFRVEADVANHVYSVRVKLSGASGYIDVATNYSFRQTQLDIDQLDHWAVYAGIGSHDVCEFEVIDDGPCPGDVNEDGSIGFEDVTELIGSWGACAGFCAADLDGDGMIGFTDLVVVLGAQDICGGCAGDVNGDGEVSFIDLTELLGVWGGCAGCTSDLDGDGNVGFVDMVDLLGALGDCP